MINASLTRPVRKAFRNESNGLFEKIVPDGTIVGVRLTLGKRQLNEAHVRSNSPQSRI
jgi:hypothetical protein